jgi:hypothetical protein
VEQCVPNPNRVLGPTATKAATTTVNTETPVHDLEGWVPGTATNGIEFIVSQFTFIVHDRFSVCVGLLDIADDGFICVVQSPEHI